MFKGVAVAAFLFLITITAQAQLPNASQGRVFQYDLIDGSQRRSIKPLAPDDQFVEPTKSLLKLNRQIDLQFLPPDFFPSFEQEDNSVKRKSLRYAVAFYRDCEVPGVLGLFDVLLGMRLDTRNGPLEVKYYRVATIVNPNKVRLPEDRPSMAILKTSECSAMLFLLDGANQQALITFEGIFTENPHPVNFIITDDVDGIKTDESVQRFAVFVRGGAARASLFVLNTDVNLNTIETFEVIRDLPATDRAYIFGILPSLVPYRGAVVTNKSDK